ncbi:hypothetical protein [Thalassospira sp. MCCC 1A03138]|uniref:hypothetical protein n=1 Tax=Thalassospira sp. MCCC 1A03138 TaxID=1470576 RepID=UPI000A1DFDCC|nr:hypothetical protein [Thalassospira sp. MCCC 1A03138]OSQ31729.1 hypothetical protein TH468_06735 [Thalassospira sp. MCCC 1A03138]
MIDPWTDATLRDGMMSSTRRLFADSKRPETERFHFVMDRHRAAVYASIDAIKVGISSLTTDRPDIGTLSVAAALEYVDFRWPDGCFAVSDDLRHWMAGMANRPAMLAMRYNLLPVRQI